MSWESLWKSVLILTLCGYAALVIVVIIGGAKNVVEMLRELRSPVESSQENDI